MSGEYLTEAERDLYIALGSALGIEFREIPVEEVEKLRADVAAGEAAEREMLAEVEEARREAAAAQTADDRDADAAWPVYAAMSGIDAEPLAVEEVRRVALDWSQVVAHDLPPQLGKATDSRAAAFEARHGRLVQVELEALPPDVLRELYAEALSDYWSEDAYRAVVEREQAERAEL